MQGRRPDQSRGVAEGLFTSASADIDGPIDLTRSLLKIANAMNVAPQDWPQRDAFIARTVHLIPLAPSRVFSLDGAVPPPPSAAAAA